MKKLFLMILCFPLLATEPIAFDVTRKAEKKVYSQAMQIASSLESRQLAEVQARTFFALGAILKTAAKALRKKGHHSEADKIENEWSDTYSVYFFRVGYGDIGDFEPLSDWLSAVYISLELLLGEYIVKSLHLDDIHIINHAIPVVFQPCKGPWIKDDYKEHFGALSGVVGYWSVFIGCTLGTSGIGLFFCMPAGMLAEFALANFLTPPIGGSIFDLFCSRETPMK